MLGLESDHTKFYLLAMVFFYRFPRYGLKNCNLDQFKPKEKIILNPTFGRGSKNKIIYD